MPEREPLDGLGRDIVIAATFLTRLPLPSRFHGRDRPLADSMRAFPIVGAAVGAAGAIALLVGWNLGFHPLASALLAIGAIVLLTGALHEDGLADVADGFGGGRTIEAKLHIMADSRIGAYGVLALLFSVGLRATLLIGFLGLGTAAVALVAAGALSRAAIPMAMAHMEPARDGLGARAGKPNNRTTGQGALMAAAIAIVALWPHETIFLSPFAGVAACAAAYGVARIGAWWARRQIGGYTGDVLGAVQQGTEVAVLATVAAFGT